MPTVETVQRSELSAVLPLLRSLRPEFDDAVWRPLFEHPWGAGRPERGWVLREHGDVVGYLGAIFSERVIDGRTRRFVNLSTWFVHPEHRSSSLALLTPVLQMSDQTVTDVTPIRSVIRITRRLGFRELDARLCLLVPPRRPATSRRADIGIHHDELPPGGLTGDARQVFDDHLGLPDCHQLVLVTPQGSCLVVYKRVVGGPQPYAHIHHVSNGALFRSHHALVRTAIHERVRSPILVTDARFDWVPRLPGSGPLPEPAIKMYRPADDIAPAAVDNLYTELILMDHYQLQPDPRILNTVERAYRSARRQAKRVLRPFLPSRSRGRQDS